MAKVQHAGINVQTVSNLAISVPALIILSPDLITGSFQMTFAWGFVVGFFVWPVSYTVFEIIESFRIANQFNPSEV
jgi:hypothetical protein